MWVPARTRSHTEVSTVRGVDLGGRCTGESVLEKGRWDDVGSRKKKVGFRIMVCCTISYLRYVTISRGHRDEKFAHLCFLVCFLDPC